MVSEPLFFLFPKSLSPTPASSLSPPTSCLFPGLTHNVSCLWQSLLTLGQREG